MEEKIERLLDGLNRKELKFTDVIAFIESNYDHQPTAFQNGQVYNEATQNQGSAKVFTFGKLKGLSEANTLKLFAEHYQAVLETPEATDHQNIRQFMITGWAGLSI